ncbi:DUF6011 domain-containing protein [Mycolicibacterium sp. 141076]|uniref:DUF6011 domain-containing protein n=1 Tax=Mycolicibacterium sp. 141076 TaxID=3090599 RepID=UPI0039A5C161
MTEVGRSTNYEEVDRLGDDWRLARRCRACGSWLTSPASVAAGIGPSCAQRESGR